MRTQKPRYFDTQQLHGILLRLVWTDEWNARIPGLERLATSVFLNWSLGFQGFGGFLQHRVTHAFPWATLPGEWHASGTITDPVVPTLLSLTYTAIWNRAKTLLSLDVLL